MAWDDELNPIDDPAAEPDLGQRVRRSKLPPADELRFLLAHGESEDTIARRFGVKPGAVARALQRARLEASTASSQRPGASGSAEGQPHEQELPHEGRQFEDGAFTPPWW